MWKQSGVYPDCAPGVDGTGGESFDLVEECQ